MLDGDEGHLFNLRETLDLLGGIYYIILGSLSLASREGFVVVPFGPVRFAP